MFETSLIEVENQKNNTIFKKSISLDQNLDCFLLISSSNKNLAENLLNNALESIIDKISKEETYNDFGIALENMNSFLKTWKTDQEVEDELDVVILILNENNLMFSNIGKSTVYLLNKNNEIIELTERDQNKKSFLFISSGILANGEIVISSTLNILKFLSKSDILDGMILSNDIEIFNKNIKNILQSEIVDKNCVISSLKYKNEFEIEKEGKIESKIEAVKEFTGKVLDLNFSKQIISFFLKIKEKINNQNQTTKNAIFFGIIIFLALILFLILDKFVGTVSETDKKEQAKAKMEEITLNITTATQNISNPGIFNRSIETAEAAIAELEKEEAYLTSVETYRSEINILKKQFNKIELFSSGQENLIYAEVNENVVKIVKDSGKTYIVTKTGVIGPIIANATPKTYIFNSLADDEYFTKASALSGNVYLITNKSKVVKFDKNGTFSFVNVAGQNTWETIKDGETYNSSLYVLGTDNQIYKHQGISTGFAQGNAYLKEDDLKNLGNLIGMAIDGGFYLVKEDLSVVKFFSNPYRIESLTVSRTPNNYDLAPGEKFEVKAGINLNYVYMLLGNKIFVFQPNTTDYKSTRNLTYIGQIEGATDKIIDFYVDSDGELTILNNKGLYKLKFEVSDDKLILR